MARYIDLDKALERLNASPAFPNMGTDGYFLLGVVEDLLKMQPTADVVPKSEVANEIIQDITKACVIKDFENIDVSIGYASAVNDILKELVAVKRKYEGL